MLEGQLSEQFSCTKYRPDSTQGKNRTTMGNDVFHSVYYVSNASAKNLYKDIIIINNLLQIKMQCNWLSYCKK